MRVVPDSGAGSEAAMATRPHLLECSLEHTGQEMASGALGEKLLFHSILGQQNGAEDR